MERGQSHLYRPDNAPKASAPQPPYNHMVPQDGNNIYSIQGTEAKQAQPVAPVVIAIKQLGPKATSHTCPSCHRKITTKVEHVATTKTHLVAMILLSMCCLPCSCIPYCTDSCRNAQHYCPSCDAYLGVYKH